MSYPSTYVILYTELRKNTKHNKKKIKISAKKFLTNLTNSSIIKVQTKKERKEKMREYKLSTARGKQLYDMGSRCCCFSLHNLYEKRSKAKEQAYNYCWEQYCKGENSKCFGVGNANRFGFTARWLETRDGEEVMRIETKDNSYLVWLNR